MEFLLYICFTLTCKHSQSSCDLIRTRRDLSFVYVVFVFAVFSGTRADDSADALREAAIVQPTAILNPFVTQNVYGFADFTTTIGNTVMIFSPSSIAAVPGKCLTNFESDLLYETCF
jgi:hypothetical protein